MAISTGNFAREYKKLNDQQKKAVDAIEGPVMVLAGPGTGKTQVLALRAANILRQTQMDPWNVLCLTFTESGVTAMRERLVQIMGPAGYQIRVATFHSFCNDVIRDFPELFAERSQWEPLSDVERVETFRDIVAKLPAQSPLKPWGNTHLYLKDIIDNINKLKQEDITPRGFREHMAAVGDYLKQAKEPLERFFALKPKERTEQACVDMREELIAIAEQQKMNLAWKSFVQSFWLRDISESTGRTKLKNDIKRWFDSYTRHLPRQRELIKVYERYQSELKKRGRYDYDDMIMSVVAKLEDDDGLLAHYQEQFQYLLVDEYQDTNSAQNEFLRLLAKSPFDPAQGPANMFVVGDDKQSIYRFQGASLENLRWFYELFKDDVEAISLKENYRSHQTILDIADAVISHNQESIGKYIDVEEKLEARGIRKEQKARAYVYPSEGAEHDGAARSIADLIKNGTEPDEIAVLYRYNRDVDGILSALRARAVPARVMAGENVLEDGWIKRLISLLEYVVRGQDEVLAQVLLYEWWGFDPVAVIKIVQKSHRERRNLFEALEESDEFREFAVKLAQWKAVSHNRTLEQTIDIILNESGYLNSLLESPQFLQAIPRLNRFLQEVKQITRSKPETTLEEFINQISVMREFEVELTAEPAGGEGKTGHVRLTTAHKAKGLEFEHVFIIHLADKQWGNARSRDRLPLPHGLLKFDTVGENFNNEDDRRLFYVAMTRAKLGLTFSVSRKNGAGREQVPSVFWHEVPEELVEREEAGDTAEHIAERLSREAKTALPKRDDTAVRAYLREYLSGYVMSVTHLNNYLECPKLFYYRNLLRVPAAKTKHMAFGTAVHNALRDFFREYTARGSLPAQEYLRDQFELHLKREGLAETDFADGLALGREALKKYYSEYSSGWAPGAITEYDFSRRGAALGNLRLTGKLDKLEAIDSKAKTAVVIDYKTGNPDNAGKKLKKDGDYYRQLVFYKLLTELSDRFEYDMAAGEIDFIQPSARTGKMVKKRFEISDADVQELKKTIEQTWKDIQALKFLDDTMACGECEYCVL